MAVVKKLLARGRLDKEDKQAFPAGFWLKVSPIFEATLGTIWCFSLANYFAQFSEPCLGYWRLKSWHHQGLKFKPSNEMPMEPGLSSACPSLMQLFQVCKALNLSPSQQGMVLELWQSFQHRMGKLLDVRRSIQRHMQGTMPDGVFGRSFAINFLKVCCPRGTSVCGKPHVAPATSLMANGLMTHVYTKAACTSPLILSTSSVLQN